MAREHVDHADAAPHFGAQALRERQRRAFDAENVPCAGKLLSA